MAKLEEGAEAARECIANLVENNARMNEHLKKLASRLELQEARLVTLNERFTSQSMAQNELIENCRQRIFAQQMQIDAQNDMIFRCRERINTQQT